MKLTYKQFRQKLKEAEDILGIIKREEIPEEVVLKCAGAECNTIEDVINRVNRYITELKITPFIFFRPNGTVNKKVFYEYYKKFIHANAEGIARYERIYRTSQSEILKFLNEIKEELESEAKSPMREIKYEF